MTHPQSPRLPALAACTPRLPLYELVAGRLDRVELLPELRRQLLELTTADDHWRTGRWPWDWVIPALQTALGGDTCAIESFVAAWTLMYAAIVRLDHLQDNDPVEDSSATPESPAAHYNLLLAYYVLASSLLDELWAAGCAPHRIHRVHRLWSDLMLRTASGQQRDLMSADEHPAGLSEYQELARAKTGSTFALAFGGTAMLLTDDQPVIDACLAVGELFGELVQYHDDVVDIHTQSATVLTLPNALGRTYPELTTRGQAPQDFWAYVYPVYRAHVEQLLAQLRQPIGARLLAIFVAAFEQTPAEPRDAS